MDAKVYRPARDWKGQRPADLEDSYIGDIDGVIMGGPAPQPVRGFPGVTSTEGMIGIARFQESGITVQPDDLLAVQNRLYLITGPRQWDFPNELTGTEFSYYWVQAENTT
ncbi:MULTISPECIES: hypothetical protein [Mycobacterium]|uniref:hypothetical protein n=1 Tax=Mycobacterium TaxID=1763 RepID=UPI0006E16D61|nr:MULTISPECIES: hypothetical protein [Mycobacterium]MDP7728482.1 hypothetical protein [Mycobacterium sp. TY813]